MMFRAGPIVNAQTQDALLNTDVYLPVGKKDILGIPYNILEVFYDPDF